MNYLRVAWVREGVEETAYHPAMSKVPACMEQFFADNSFVLVYPVQAGDTESWYI